MTRTLTITETKPNDKAVSIDLNNTSIIDLYDFIDKKKPLLHVQYHHRGPVSVQTMGFIDKWKHSVYMKKMRKKNEQLHRSFEKQKPI